MEERTTSSLFVHKYFQHLFFIILTSSNFWSIFSMTVIDSTMLNIIIIPLKLDIETGELVNKQWFVKKL